MAGTICGSCYVFNLTDEDVCPRCEGPMHPGPIEVLTRFVEHGINPFYEGVPLPQAQQAAKDVLAMLGA